MSAEASTSAIPPKPVAPAETIPGGPKAALEGLAEPSVLDKVMETVKPYIEKVEATTKPYTDAGVAKAKELVEKLENAPLAAPGSFPASIDAGVPPYAAPTGEKSIPADGASTTASSTTTTTTTTSATSEIKATAQGIFEQVQKTFTSVTHTIDEKTASPTHPGIISQVTEAVHKVVDKVEHFVNEHPIDGTALAAGTPAVQTTTNSVPHGTASSSTAVPPL